MAIHELYVGGPPSRNYSQAMFPAVPFNAAAPGFQVGPAAHKGPIGFNLERLLDFGGDHALGEFNRENTVAQGDDLGVVLIPKNVLFLGFYVRILTPVAGLTLTPKLRGNAAIFTAIDASAVAEGFVPAGGGAMVTDGAVDLGAALFNVAPDMLDLTLTALPAGGLGAFKAEISPVVLATNIGGYR